MKHTFYEYLQRSPSQIRKDRSDLSLVSFVGLAKPTFDGKIMSPQVAALRFYLLNHLTSEISAQHHPEEHVGKYLPLFEQYEKCMLDVGLRMVRYMLFICHRETRHNKWSSMAAKWKTFIEKNHKAEILEYAQSHCHDGSSASAELLRDTPLDVTLGEYTKFMRDIFYKGKYATSYGGKAWGAIADVLHNFVTGEISLEIFLDTSFTLAHNTGPIFNKGMYFSGDKDSLIEILDVQRSGQIPQYVEHLNLNLRARYVNDEGAMEMDKVIKNLGLSSNEHVDWFLVEDLGSVSTYAGKKIEQKSKYGEPEWYIAKMASKKAEQAQAAEKAAQDAIKKEQDFCKHFYKLDHTTDLPLVERANFENLEATA